MINYLNRLYTNDIFKQLEQYNKMENNNDNKSKSNKNTKKSNEIGKIDVKLNKNIGKNKEENIKKKGKLEIELDNKKIKNKDDNIIFIVVEKNGSLKETEIKENSI